MAKYTIGLDYGTLSGRAVLVDVKDGREVASAVYEYPHAVMTRQLPTGEKLGNDWALQHPQDYLDVLYHVIPEIMKESGVSPADVIGIGTDVTASTVMPVDKDGVPLCFKEEYKHRPHAYVKLWKHHAAQDKANEMTRIAKERGVNEGIFFSFVLFTLIINKCVHFTPLKKYYCICSWYGLGKNGDSPKLIYTF